MDKVFIFDADGVVIRGDIFSNRYAQEFGIDLELFTTFFRGPFQDCLIGKKDLKQELKPYLQSWGWTKSVDKLLDYWFCEEKNIDLQVIQQINGLKVKDIKCYCATNQEKYRTEYIKNKLGFQNIFAEVFSSCDLGCKKPEQEFYSQIFKSIDATNPNQVFFIDDDEQNVSGAKQFGFNAFCYTEISDLVDIVQNL